MENLTLCRTCLSQSSLKPIFVDSIDHTEYFNAIFVITGIKVETNDGLPQKMCTDCVEFLNVCLKFRKKCKDSETYLLDMKKQIEVDENLKEAESLVRVEICMEETKIDCVDEDDKPLTHFVDKTNASSQDFESNNDFHGTEDENIRNINTQESKTKIIEFVENNTLVENHKVISENVKTTDASVIEPLYEVLDSDKKRVLCKLCQKELSIRSIDSHVSRNHPGADETRVKCELCDRYVTKAKLNRHMLLMHGSDTFKCVYCKSELDSRDSLVAHAAACDRKKKKRKPSEAGRQLSQCALCHKTMQRASLSAHTRRHQGAGPVCEHCGLRLSNRLRLNEHLRAKHGHDKLQCRYCDFRSAGLPSLINHERRHRGEKPFVCESCGAKFHAAYLLAQHKHSHRTEKLVKCELCPATFKANNSLHTHKLSCHGSAMFRCGQCGRSYRARHYAVRHLRQVHRYRGNVPPVRVETGVVSV